MTTSTTRNQINIRSSRPSRRDFEIFRLAEIVGLTHAEIALNSNKITRRRVSQIVARVRRWLSLHPCDDPLLASELQRKQLARHLERMHLENIITKARDELIYGKKELTTTSTKDDGSKTTTTRQQPFNVQVLKTYLRAVQALAKLQQTPDVNIPTPEECQFPWLEGAINEVYDKWRDKIWSGKLKPEGICDLIDQIVAAVLKAAAAQARAHADDPVGCVDPVGRAVPAEAVGRPAPAAQTPLPLGEGGGQRPPGEGVPAPIECTEPVARAVPAEAVGRAVSAEPAVGCVQSPPGDATHQSAPATLARSASEGNVASLASADSTADQVSSTVDVGPETSDSVSLSTEYSVRSTPTSQQASDEANPKSKIKNPKSTSLASLREAPRSQTSNPTTEAATASAVTPCAETSTAETTSITSAPSQKNPKREAPLDLSPPALCPLVSPSPCPAEP